MEATGFLTLISPPSVSDVRSD